MISIHHLAGYKYIGGHPDAGIGENRGTFRDNLTYLNVAFTDWEADKEKLRFIVEEHLRYLDLALLERLVGPYVVENATPALHLIFAQNDFYDEVGGSLKFQASTGDDPATVFVQEGRGQENVLALIARKKHFYRVELPAKKAAQWAQLMRVDDEEEPAPKKRLAPKKPLALSAAKKKK